jgi:methylase of polypeptide subunit release factors
MVNSQSLIELADHLKTSGYNFVTPTPATHHTVLQRAFNAHHVSALDIFGWNRPFKKTAVNESLWIYLQNADILSEHENLFKSKVRFSSLDRHLFMHSAYPTLDSEDVFFGPDSYRFASLIKKTIARFPAKSYKKIVDIATGSGVGGIVAASCLQHKYQELIFADINPKALEYAKINAEVASVTHAKFFLSDLYSAIQAPVDLIIANPPYLIDVLQRAYRHGGGAHGSQLSTRIVLEGLPMLADGGVMILYTASPIIDGQDTFLASIRESLQGKNIAYTYEEIDPDVFGEELLKEAYKKVDRIAVVSLVLTKSN